MSGLPRPEHEPKGSPCLQCGLPAYYHVKRIRTIERREYFEKREKTRKTRSFRPHQPKKPKEDHIIGIDGEGQGRFPHNYTFLAASDEAGKSWKLYDGGKALSTKACLEFFVSLPLNALVVGFALGYDLTKLLKDLPNNLLYALTHEKERLVKTAYGVKYKKVTWQGFKLDYMNRKLSITHGSRHVELWDVFGFYQQKFTGALINWGIGSKEAIEKMAEMKEKRDIFDQLSQDQIQAYCLDECRHLAKLVRALIDAHNEAGLKLKNYYGAGSTASSLLNRIGIKKVIREPMPEMRDAVACSFFGGRFENSIVGPVKGTVYNYDISSAYPYQTTFLPCLIHGKWEFQTNPRIRDIERARLALVHWKSSRIKGGSVQAWGPFPVRSPEGTIAFPIASAGGWVWKDEYLAGAKYFPNVSCSEAWLYHCDCDCWPFESVPPIYVERCRIGKEGKGIVLKLGPNSIYGKMAQSKGYNPPFQCWIYASNITSGCRAQLLESFGCATNPWDILMFATDGIWSRVKLELPKPRDTGSFQTGKPLGGWEGPDGTGKHEFPSGVFCVRPGIYFPINPNEEELKEVRARGLGKKILYEQWRAIMETFEKGGPKAIHKITTIRFIGMKSSLSKGLKTGLVKRSPNYGEWIQWPIEVSFNPRPKREKIMSENRLKPWDYLPHSIPYAPAKQSTENVLHEKFHSIIEEQPDSDLHFTY